MTALPSNLAMVGEDLARATLKDVKRSVRRRRLVTYAVAFALLALMASAAIATGWLTDKAPTAGALQSLNDGAAAGEATVLLTGLGSAGRSLSATKTADGTVCLTLTGFPLQCVPTFLTRQEISWFIWSSQSGPTLVWGVVRPEVASVEAVSSDGRITPARFDNDAFYVELDSPPAHLIAHLADGTAVNEVISPCPQTDPNCAP